MDIKDENLKENEKQECIEVQDQIENSDSDFDILQEILNIRRKIVPLYGF